MQFWPKGGQNWEKNEVKFLGTKLTWGDRLWSKSEDSGQWEGGMGKIFAARKKPWDVG